MSAPPGAVQGRPICLAEAQALVAAIQGRLAERGLRHRSPPPVPTTCCGRGCNGCVWDGYYQALLYWRDDARALLGEPPP